MPIPTLPTAPDPNDPATFNSRASAWVAALDAWTAAVNALPAITASYAFTDGTSSAPSVAFASDTNTGMFKVSGDKLGFAAGGATCLSLSQSGIDSDYPARFKAPADAWTSSGAFFGVGGLSSMNGQLSSEGSNAVHLTSNGYRDNTAGTNLWVSHASGGSMGAAQVALDPTGFVSLRAQTTKNTGDAFSVTEVARAFGSGQFGISDGTASLPSLTWLSDTDTGLFRPLANNIAFAVGGVEAWRINSAGGLYAGSPNSVGGVGASEISIQGTTTNTSQMVIMRQSADVNPPQIILAKSRGTVVDDYSILSANDLIGRFAARGADGAGTTIFSARMDFIVEGTPAATDVRAGIRFYTGSGAGVTGEALRLTTGQAVLAQGTGGLGYGSGSGAGGGATQLTSKATGVTLSKPSGVITTHNAALAGNAKVQFTVTNSGIVATDAPQPVVQSPTGKYFVRCVGVAAGSYVLELENITAGSLSEAVLINVPVLKNSNS